eukprot:TRINITY_DN864_c1_g1_i4.p1 TRINITY_DN864_c1_g1~~TRINITY_DN864_c1_g1_i4.p1  ORF type:complete len:274 (+),score=61.86 TRINITY_DN864_c1_g1_i4:86-907(+)
MRDPRLNQMLSSNTVGPTMHQTVPARDQYPLLEPIDLDSNMFYQLTSQIGSVLVPTSLGYAYPVVMADGSIGARPLNIQAQTTMSAEQQVLFIGQLIAGVNNLPQQQPQSQQQQPQQQSWQQPQPEQQAQQQPQVYGQQQQPQQHDSDFSQSNAALLQSIIESWATPEQAQQQQQQAQPHFSSATALQRSQSQPPQPLPASSAAVSAGSDSQVAAGTKRKADDASDSPTPRSGRQPAVRLLSVARRIPACSVCCPKYHRQSQTCSGVVNARVC